MNIRDLAKARVAILLALLAYPAAAQSPHPHQQAPQPRQTPIEQEFRPYIPPLPDPYAYLYYPQPVQPSTTICNQVGNMLICNTF